MKAKNFFYVVIAGLCLVLFYSLHLMTNNIDKDSESTNDRDDSKMLWQFKENVAKLREQINKNEEKIGQIKDILSDLKETRKDSDKNVFDKKFELDFKPEEKDISWEKNTKKIPLSCPANTLKRSSHADIQMAKVLEKLPFDNIDGGVWKQGYPIKYKPIESESEKLKVFVIPHSHCDPGWLKTFEQYFHDQTAHILNLAVDKLTEYPSMRFVYAEMSYFNLWWQTLSTGKKDIVKNLLDEGRLEVVSGGWVMPDEANSHYFAMLDQLIEGSQWLYNQLGFEAKSGWSIDPFGHSPTMAYLLKRSGLQNMLIQRTHYEVKKELSLAKQLEFKWRQGWDSAGSTDMLCHMMPFYSYDVPHTCGPDPKICCQFDFRRSYGTRFSCPWKINPMSITEDNVEERARTLLDQYRKKASLYKNNIVLVPLGDDFRYDVSEEWDKQHNNYAKLFAYMNQQTAWNVEAKFATLTEYFDELRKRTHTVGDQLPSDYPSLSGDFFVYADRDNHYWSGYFTSRPFYKRLDRELEYHQRTAELLFSTALATARGSKDSALEDLMNALVQARRHLGLFQHHDGITGTSKTFVVDDYGDKLLSSISALKDVIRSSAQYLLLLQHSALEADQPVFDVDESRQHHSDIAVATVVDLSGAPRTVFFYNSLAQSRSSIVTVYVTSPHVEVRDHRGQVCESQVDPVWEDDGISTSHFRIHFVADIAAMAFASFQLKKVSDGANPLNHLAVLKVCNTHVSSHVFQVLQDSSPSIENHHHKVLISCSTGLAEALEMKDGGGTRQMQIQFVRYDTTRDKDRSGAYLFMPGGEAKVLEEAKPSLTVSQGPLVQEAVTRLSLVRHSIRAYSSKAAVSAVALDILNVVDIRDTSNTELAMRIVTDVHNDNEAFYTDLNGFQVLKRRHYSKLPLQANFYPMSAFSFIQEAKSRFTLLTGQSLGVASLKQGWLEVMQDRRLDQDDNRGMGQDVRDNKRTPNHFRLLFESKAASSSGPEHESIGFLSMNAHFSSLDLLHPPFLLPLIPRHAPASLFKPLYSSLHSDLPCDVHLLNLRSLVEPGDEAPGTVLKVKASHRTALLLHKTVFSCEYGGSPLANCSANSLKISSLFSNLKVNKLTRTKLNLRDGEKDEDLSLPSSVPPMEIAAYVFQFE